VAHRGEGAGTARTASLKYGGPKMPSDLKEMLQRQIFFSGPILSKKNSSI
jgi:hypothetical protein